MLTSYNENVTVVKDITSEDIQTLDHAFSDCTDLVVDVEAVDLSREGDVSLVSIATRTHCYLFDVLDCTSITDNTICYLKRLLEDESKKKVVHDCRMDSDALEHICKVRIKNVHDTSCFHTVLHGEKEVSLNNLLAYYNITKNTVRDRNVYKQNHAFWATRPLTDQMIEWASNDVLKLFQVYDEQILEAIGNNKMLECLKMTEYYRTFCVNANVKEILVKNPGAFIGQGGSNIKALRHRTNTCIYHRGCRDENNFLVYYKHKKDFDQVQRVARR